MPEGASCAASLNVLAVTAPHCAKTTKQHHAAVVIRLGHERRRSDDVRGASLTHCAKRSVPPLRAVQRTDPHVFDRFRLHRKIHRVAMAVATKLADTCIKIGGICASLANLGEAPAGLWNGRHRPRTGAAP
jgi:hypothetical protein